jgi:RNase adaptor protein for sRNA GlmZ degradation
LLTNYDLGVELPHLKEVLSILVDTPIFNFPEAAPGKLTVTICSFSYKRGIPDDLTGNGGGFVFDCRALPNPGRYDQYRSYTGLDTTVKDFLNEKEEVTTFLKLVSQLVFASVDDYSARGFEHLMISFGCTGGQHRSVYCAEHLYNELKSKFNVRLHLVHREIENRQQKQVY